MDDTTSRQRTVFRAFEYQEHTRPTYAWYVVAVLMLANVSAFVDRQILGVLVEPIKRDFGISDAEMSYLSAAFTLFFAVMGLPIARLAGRVGRRNVMAAGVTLWSVFTILCATAQTYARLFVMRIGVGAGEASLNAHAKHRHREPERHEQ